MQRSVYATFDGEVLRPEEPLDLVLNGRYRVTIDVEAPVEAAEQEPGILDDLDDLAVDFGVPDLAEQHDHYLYGTPKR